MIINIIKEIIIEINIRIIIFMILEKNELKIKLQFNNIIYIFNINLNLFLFMMIYNKNYEIWIIFEYDLRIFHEEIFSENWIIQMINQEIKWENLEFQLYQYISQLYISLIWYSNQYSRNIK